MEICPLAPARGTATHDLLYPVDIVTNAIHMHDMVALLEGTRATHFQTHEPLLLHRGQLGTVVMTYDGSAFEVEFADRDGHPYTLMPVAAEKLMLLRDSPDFVAA